jgi:uncharacterized SAM-binding protein YcdF (DUF218 family)
MEHAMEMSPFLFGLYKLVKFVVYPYTWLAVLSGAVTVLVFLPSSAGRTRWLRILTVATLSIVWLLGAPAVSTIALGLLEAHYPPFDRAAAAQYDAIIVLGGGVSGGGSLRPTDQLTGLSMQRILCGADLFVQGRAPKLVLSGGDGAIFGVGPKEAVAMKRLAVRIGVPEQAILLEEQARSTYENAVGARRLLGGTSILLVTSASHMARAAALFHKQGFDVTPAPCNYNVREWPQFWHNWDPFALIPDIHALSETSMAITEVVGIIVYWITGKL